MGKMNTKKIISTTAALCMFLQTAPYSSSFGFTASADMNYANAIVENQGSAEGNAVIKGSAASVIHDDTFGSDVLDLHGDRFGSGWLQLPQMFSGGCKNGFTFSLKFNLDSRDEKYMRLFQFSPLSFGSGNAPSYNSPDISVDLNTLEHYRTTVFVGKGSTADQKSIFELGAEPDFGKWHELTAVYTPDNAQYYLDGVLLSTEETENLSDTMKSLFSGDMLSSYIYNSIGHSLYTDHDIMAKIDDVTMYDYALTAEQVTSLPDDALYRFTFEQDTIKEGEAVPEQETAFSENGTPLTSLPELETSSPDNSLITKFWVDGRGSYYYSVHKYSGGSLGTVIEPSKLGIITTTEDLSSGFSQIAPTASVVENDEIYSMPYGKHTTIRNHYKELTFPLKKGNSTLTVYVRVYDDGMAFRYGLDHGASIKEEQSQVVFPKDGVLWGNMPNATYEWDYTEFTIEKMTGSWVDYSVPLTGNISNKYWVTLSEANVFNESDPYCAGYFRTTGGTRALTWKFGMKTESVTMGSAFHTPWRAAVIADNLNDMSCSDLILNLNPPSVLDDTSWIKPGKVAWSWWSSGGDSPIEYHTQKDYINFAAENGWDYVCLDFGWALWDDSASKVKELCDYAAEKGIGIFLWYGVNNKGHDIYRDSAGHPAYPYYSLLDEETIVREFERITSLGVKGVKVDYYESDTQQTMKQMNLCASIAAKNKLMVLFHGCTLPRGESRTYPNIVSYEAVNGTEYYKWFKSPSLQNRVSYTFTRNVVGSADFTPTGLPVFNSKATAGFALADTVNIESGLQHFAHSIYTYQGTDALAFLNDVPVTWDELKILDGRPMQFNVTARRNGNNWYIGASTINRRKVSVMLSDLITDDDTYTAYLFGDNADGSKVEITVIDDLTKDSVIEKDLLDNGGFVMKLTKSGMKLTTPYSNYKFYEAEQAKISGKAGITSGNDGKYSSGNAYVGYIGGAGNDLTFENVTVDKAGEYTLRIYYVSGERRNLSIDVNGTWVRNLEGLYANRNDWSGIAGVDTTVTLKEGRNTIKLYNNSGNAPSIDRIAIAIPTESIIGDIDLSVTHNVADLVLMQRYLHGKEKFNKQQAEMADINSDKIIDIFDLIALRKIFITLG